MTGHPPLTEVFKGQDPVVDIVAVHGLKGDPFRTWTTEKTGKFWLGDPELLPFHLKNSRILTFSYNANVTALFGKTSSDGILQHAQTLTAELVADRELEGAMRRPLIFICHSMGGIIVKRVGLLAYLVAEVHVNSIQALVYSASRTSTKMEDLHSIFISTYAVLFLGTPHSGSAKASIASTARRIIDAVVPSKLLDTDGQLLEALREDSEILQSITQMFVPLMKNFHICFFWEQEKTDLGTTKDYVVDEMSAAPILYDTFRAGLPYDHRNMCRFESRTSPGFKLIAARLLRYSMDAPATIRQRWEVAIEMLRIKRANEAVGLLL